MRSTHADNRDSSARDPRATASAHVQPATTASSSRDALVEECAAALVAGVRRLQRRVPRHHAPRAAALRGARLARQPARCGRAHRALRQVRQSRRRADARRGSAKTSTERALWSSIKRRFTELIDALPDREFDKTFFNSVTRRTFGTIGVDAAVEFVALDLDPIGVDHLADRDQRLREPRLARAAVRGSARRLPLPHAVPRLRSQRAHHHQRSARAVRSGFRRVAAAAAGRADRVHPHACSIR